MVKVVIGRGTVMASGRLDAHEKRYNIARGRASELSARIKDSTFAGGSRQL